MVYFLMFIFILNLHTADTCLPGCKQHGKCIKGFCVCDHHHYFNGYACARKCVALFLFIIMDYVSRCTVAVFVYVLEHRWNLMLVFSRYISARISTNNYYYPTPLSRNETSRNLSRYLYSGRPV